MDNPNHILSLSSLSILLSYCFYLLEINDWLLDYEIGLDLLLVFSFIAAIGFLSLYIVKAAMSRRLPSPFSLIFFLSMLSIYIFTYGNRNGFFWGKQILNAAFIDDRSRIDLELYENGKYFIYHNWLFAEKRFEGTYQFNQDTITFYNAKVIDNEFISQKIVVDNNNNRIYFKKDTDGNYDKSFYYFQIGF